MPYAINKYNGTLIATVADGTIDNTTDLKIIGKNYAGYGEVQNENLLFLLENFANNNPPPRPISGQIWFDSANSKLKFYDGSKFRTTGGAEVSTTAPVGLTVGDFWWDVNNKQLRGWDGANFVLIGPAGVPGANTTQMESISLLDTTGTSHAVIRAQSNGNTIFVVNSDQGTNADGSWSLQTPFDGFTKIYQGVTLAYSNDDSRPGETTTGHRFHGTSTDSERLGGKTASEYLLRDQTQFTGAVNFADIGYTIGAVPKLKVFNSGTTPTIQNVANDTIQFQTTVSGVTRTPLTLVGLNVTPGGDNVSDLGTPLLRFKNVYGVSFVGTATRAETLQVGADFRTASSTSGAGTVVVRTNVDETINGVNILAGAIKGTYFVGTATSANYADLAEKYLADSEYEIGTVVTIGGEKEVTASKLGDRAIGAVSGSPAYMMNSELEGGTYIALKGRVPVKVTGSVIKGQRLVAGPNGTAQSAMGNTADVFAIALESNNNTGVKLVECLVL
jgi:hypothetical protein